MCRAIVVLPALSDVKDCVPAIRRRLVGREDTKVGRVQLDHVANVLALRVSRPERE